MRRPAWSCDKGQGWLQGSCEAGRHIKTVASNRRAGVRPSHLSLGFRAWPWVSTACGEHSGQQAGARSSRTQGRGRPPRTVQTPPSGARHPPPLGGAKPAPGSDQHSPARSPGDQLARGARLSTESVRERSQSLSPEAKEEEKKAVSTPSGKPKKARPHDVSLSACRLISSTLAIDALSRRSFASLRCAAQGLSNLARSAVVYLPPASAQILPSIW